jgi:hypothetical protein
MPSRSRSAGRNKMLKTKPHRGLSEYVFQSSHIDPMTKATIVTMIRAKEDTIANLVDLINEAPITGPFKECGCAKCEWKEKVAFLRAEEQPK